MSLNNQDLLETLFHEVKSSTEVSDCCNDEEYKRFNELVTGLAEPMLMANLHDISFVIKCISYFPHLYSNLPVQLRSNPEIALITIKKESKNLAFLPHELQENQEFREKLFFLDPALNMDFDFIAEDEQLVSRLLDKIAEDEYFFKDAPQALRHDRHFCLQAAERNGMILHFLPGAFYEDEELTRTALMTHGIALKYAHPKFQKSLPMVLLAISSDISPIRFAHPSLFNETELDFLWQKPEWSEFKKKELELLEKGYEKHLGTWSR